MLTHYHWGFDGYNHYFHAFGGTIGAGTNECGLFLFDNWPWGTSDASVGSRNYLSTLVVCTDYIAENLRLEQAGLRHPGGCYLEIYQHRHVRCTAYLRRHIYHHLYSKVHRNMRNDNLLFIIGRNSIVQI